MAQRQCLAEPTKDHLLVRNEARQSHAMDANPPGLATAHSVESDGPAWGMHKVIASRPLHQAGRVRRGPRRRVGLAIAVVLNDLRMIEKSPGNRREVHQHHRAHRQVRGKHAAESCINARPGKAIKISIGQP